MGPLERARLEKALADHGFDLTPVLDGEWLLGRSTQHPIVVWLRYGEGGAIILAADSGKLRAALVKEGFACEDDGTLRGQAKWKISSHDFSAFHWTLGRFAALARSLPNQVAERFAAATRNLPKNTEAERLVVQRVGQNLFREALIDYWQGRCPLTGLNLVPLLRASHIKAWAECGSDEERLDVFNGLLLAPHMDALFDGGWISFSEDGSLLVSPNLTESQRQVLGLTRPFPTLDLTPEHQRYLAYHRRVKFGLRQ